MARKRVVLNSKLAREIESLAPTFAESMRRGSKSQLSNALAVQFGVDAKTIRDIWNRKSWKGFNDSSNSQAAQSTAESFPSVDNDAVLEQQWDSPLLLENADFLTYVRLDLDERVSSSSHPFFLELPCIHSTVQQFAHRT